LGYFHFRTTRATRERTNVERAQDGALSKRELSTLPFYGNHSLNDTSTDGDKTCWIALTVERSFLITKYQASGNGCCEGLDHPAIRDCQQALALAFPDASANQQTPMR
jgi:hypothetical protein